MAPPGSGPTSRQAARCVASVGAKEDEEGGPARWERCVCDIRIEGESCTALIDTGAVTTLVSQDLLARTTGVVRKEEPRILLKSASGHAIQVQCLARLKFEIAGEVRLHWAYVCARLPYRAIVGFDFIRAQGMRIDGRNNTIQIGEQTLRLKDGAGALSLGAPVATAMAVQAGGNDARSTREDGSARGSAQMTVVGGQVIPPSAGARVQVVMGTVPRGLRWGDERGRLADHGHKMRERDTGSGT